MEISAYTDLDFDHLPSPLMDVAWRPSFVVRYFYGKLGAKPSARKQTIRSRMVDLGSEL